MSTAPQRGWSLVYQASRRVRVDAVAAVALAAAAVAPVVLLVAWLVGDRWGLSGPGPLVLVGLSVAAGVVMVLVLARRWVKPITDAAVMKAAERALSWPEGRLRGVVELGGGLPPGVSAALLRRRERELEARLAGASSADFAGALGKRARGRRGILLALVGGLALITAAAGFSAPERAVAGWTPLLHPVLHLRGPTLPGLEVAPGHAEVARGTMLELVVTAPMRRHVVIEWRTAGDVPREIGLSVEEGRARGEIGPVDGLVEYRARAPDGAVSETYQARPVDPLLLSGLVVKLVYPSYLGRDVERLQGEIPPLSVPEGTLVRLRGRATRTLETATLRRDDGREVASATDGSTFRLDWRLDAGAGGRWTLELRDDTGSRATSAELELAVLTDARPEVRIVVPGMDTVLAPSLRQGLVIDARDDNGLAAAELVYRRVGQKGHAGAERRVTLPVDPGADRALIRAVLDASAEPLVPGDAVEYHVVARDNSPSAQTGRSETYRLRLASMAELRDLALQASTDVRAAARDAAERARELDRSTREQNLRAAADGRGSRSTSDPSAERAMLGFERASQVERLVSDHEDGLNELAELRKRLEALQEAIDRSGVRDPSVQQRMDQLRDLYRRLDSPEARRQIEALREAVEALDPGAVAEALEGLSERHEELRESLEESLALLDQAAVEQELVTLVHEAEEIAVRQEAVSEAMRQEAADEASTTGEDGDGDSSAAAEQEDVAEQTRRWTDWLGSLQRLLRLQGDSPSSIQLGEAGEKGESAQASMDDAAEQARRQKGEEAARSAEQAAAEMAAAAGALDEARSGMAEAMRGEVQESTEEAALEALRLAEREEQLRQTMAQAQGGTGQPGGVGDGELRQVQSEQAAVLQGLQQLERNLSETAQKNGRLDREVSQALARALLDLERTRGGLEVGGPMPVREAERAVDSLNRLAMALLENDTQPQEGSAGAAEQALQQLAELAREQSLINVRSESVAPREAGDRPASEGLRQLAEAQRGIARRVGEASGMLGGHEDALGRLDHLSLEAEAIASELDGGRLDGRVRARQEQLFHRLLDAGRSLEREEYSPERVGEAGGATNGARPAALDPRLLDGDLRYPGPTAEQLRTLPPAYRRLILRYFERLNAAPATPPTSRDGEP